MLGNYLWQEYDCPYTGMDFDLCGEDIVAKGDSVICSCCGRGFIASEETVANTYIKSANGTLSIVKLPKNVEEKQALISRANKLVKREKVW